MPGDETRSREESEMKRLSKKEGWSVTSLPKNATSAEYTAFKKLVQEKIMKSKNERSMAQCVAEVCTAAATPLDSGFQGGMRGNEKLESEVQDSHHISNLPPVTEEGSDLSTESEKQNDEKQKANINTKEIESDQEEV